MQPQLLGSEFKLFHHISYSHYITATYNFRVVIQVSINPILCIPFPLLRGRGNY